LAGTWVTDLTPGGPYGLVGSPIQVLGLGLPPGQWDWSLSQGSVSRRHTGMPTLGCRHWDAMAGWDAQLREHRPHGAAAVPRWLKGRRWVIGTRAVALGFAASVRSRLKDTGMSWLGHRHQGSSSGICRQPRRSVFGSRTLGCQGWDVQLREHRPHGAAAVPRWLKVCGLVSCVGWSQLWLGGKTTSRCQIHSLRVCVCVSVTSVQARER